MLKIKALFLAANPGVTNRLALDEEIRLIEEMLRKARYRNTLTFQSAWAVRPDDLLQLLNEHQPHIVHFSGHGVGEGLQLAGENGEAKLVTTLALKRLFTVLKDNIRLILLNACYSREQAQALVEVIDCVIGMNESIGDEAAAIFAASFYRALGFGRSVQNAFDQGLVALSVTNILEEDIPKLLVKDGVDPNQIVLVGGRKSRVASPTEVIPPPVQTRLAATPSSNQSEANGEIETKKTPVEVFISYSHKDKLLRDQLAIQLSNLRRQGVIRDWFDGDIIPGTEWRKQIQQHLESAQIILLLISADFMASEFCYSIEMTRAIERHENGNACVLPILLRSTDYEGAPFAKLLMLPSDAKPITRWSNQDDAFEDIVKGVRRAIEDLQGSAPLLSSGSPSNVTGATSMGVEQVAVWNVPFRRNPFFTGREHIFTQIHSFLRARSTAVLTQPPAISGLGGIGKTQTAVEYAYRYRKEYQYVLWVQANTQETLLLGFVALARLLNLPEKDAKEQQTVFQALKQWLETHSGWLLIFDNADELAMVGDYLPEGNQGQTLLTTRAQAMGGFARKIDLDTMELKEGAALLLKRAGIITPGAPFESAAAAERALALDIVRALDGLPLALDQAGAYIEETGESLSNYLAMYQQQRAELLKRRGRLVPNHPESVATTWSLAFEQVEGANPAAIELMRFCAFLAPDAIPEELIIEGAPHLGPVLQPVASRRMSLNAALAELFKYSLMRRDATTHIFTIHRLVQAVIEDEMDEETQQQWAERAVRALNRVFPFDELPPWPYSQRYLPHALNCKEFIQQRDITLDEAANLLRNAGTYLINRGQYREAEPLYQYALSIQEKRYGRDHSNTEPYLNNLAVLFYIQGKYDEAKPLYQRSLAICEKIHGPEYPGTARTLNNLANLYSEQGKYDEAEPLFQRALAIEEKIHGPGHSSTARALNNLANLYSEQGKYDEAEPLFQRAFTIYEKVLGHEHTFTVSTLDNLANLYSEQGKYNKAEPLHQEALAIREKVLGYEHPETASTLDNLANLYSEQGKYDEAEPLFQRGLAICEKVLGPDHPSTTKVRENYNNLLQKMKQKREVADQQG